MSEQAVTQSRATLEALLRWAGTDASTARAAAHGAVYRLDALLSPVEELLARTFDARPDVVVGNPPYVKLQNLVPEHRAALMAAYPGLAKGSFSLSLLFVIRCLDLVGDGVCGLITQNNLFTSLAARGVRKRLQDGRRVLRVVDFNHRKVFPGASAYTCLVYLGGGGGREDLEFAAVHDDDIERGLGGLKFDRISYAELSPRKWRLAARCDLDNVRRIETAGTPIGRACDIRVGFATLLDRAFCLQRHEDAWMGRCPEGVLHPVEEEASRPFYKIPEVARVGLAAAQRRVIFPYEGPAWALVPWEDLAVRWPQVAAHLERWRTALRGRDKGAIDPDNWYAWGRRQSFDAPGPKLLTATFNRRPSFLLDPSDALFCNGYSVALRDGAPLSIHALKRLLNSRVMHYYACVTSFHIDGGYQCYQKNFIETFTIPPLNDGLLSALEAGDDDLDTHLAAAWHVAVADVDRLLSRYQS